MFTMENREKDYVLGVSVDYKSESEYGTQH
jgi:hypothetical protein